MVDELEKNKIIDTELAEMDRAEELEKTRYGIEEKNSLMATNETRSVNESGRVCHAIGKNNFINIDTSLQPDGVYFSNDFLSVTLDPSMRGDLYFIIYTDIDNSKDYTIYFNVTGLAENEEPRYNLYSWGPRYILHNGINIVNINSGTSIYNNRLLFDDQDRNLYSFNSVITLNNIMVVEGLYNENSIGDYEPYDGCLYGLELYDTIEPNFITDNYYINCGIISIFLALIILIVNAPFIFIRKVKGN